MNRFSRQQQEPELTRLAQAPAHPVLIQMLSMAQKNARKVITISWQTQPSPEVYVLEVVFTDDTKDFVGRRSAGDSSRVPRWTLSCEIEDKRTEIWSHISGDVGLIQNLIWSETTGTNQETAETMFLTTNAAKLGGGSTRQPMSSQYTSGSTTGSTPSLNLGSNSPSQFPDMQQQQSQQIMQQAPSSQPAQNVPQNVTLAGQLAEIDLSGIFQSIMICKMTGRLDIQDRLYQAEIFFDDGAVVHAQLQNALSDSSKMVIGDQALLTVLTWDDGSFLFQKDRKTSERSVKRRLEGLLLEGASLRDYHKYLRTMGVSEDSVLHKRNPDLSEELINEKLVDGVPIDPNIQKKMYNAIDGKKSLISIIDSLNMSKTLWTPIVFNLFSCELISSERDNSSPATAEEAPPIDQSMVLQAGRHLSRPETGLFSFPLFIYFLEQEFARLTRATSTVSVVVLELKNRKESLSNQALQQVAECFDTIKAKYDIIAHYKVFDFIILLPLRTDEESRDFVRTFYETLKKTPLDGVVGPDDLAAVFGISSAPADKDTLASLLTAAEQAKNECIAKAAICLSARDLRWESHSQRATKAASARNFVEAEAAWVAACNEAEHFKQSDPRLMRALEGLVSLQISQEKYAGADSVLELLLGLKEHAHGVSSVEAATVLSELARCYYMQGKYGKAEPLLRKIVDIYTTIYGDQHLASASALYNLGTLYHVQNRLGEVKPIFRKVLDIRTSLLGAEHADTVKIKQQFDTVNNAQDGQECFTTGSFKKYVEMEGEVQ